MDSQTLSEKETEEKEEEDWLERARSLENHKEEEKKEEEFVSADEEVSGGEEKKEEGVSLSSSTFIAKYVEHTKETSIYERSLLRFTSVLSTSLWFIMALSTSFNVLTFLNLLCTTYILLNRDSFRALPVRIKSRRVFKGFIVLNWLVRSVRLNHFHMLIREYYLRHFKLTYITHL